MGLVYHCCLIWALAPVYFQLTCLFQSWGELYLWANFIFGVDFPVYVLLSCSPLVMGALPLVSARSSTCSLCRAFLLGWSCLSGLFSPLRGIFRILPTVSHLAPVPLQTSPPTILLPSNTIHHLSFSLNTRPPTILLLSNTIPHLSFSQNTIPHLSFILQWDLYLYLSCNCCHGLKWKQILRFSLCPGVYYSEILIFIGRFDVVSCFGLSSLSSLCFLRWEKCSTNGSVVQDFSYAYFCYWSPQTSGSSLRISDSFLLLGPSTSSGFYAHTFPLLQAQYCLLRTAILFHVRAAIRQFSFVPYHAFGPGPLVVVFLVRFYFVRCRRCFKWVRWADLLFLLRCGHLLGWSWRLA